MSSSAWPPEESRRLELDKLVDVAALQRIVQSLGQLFGVPLRLFSTDGTLIAEHGQQAALCALVNETPAGRRECSAIVAEVKRTSAAAGKRCTVPCFTSARYEVIPIEHGSERAGRLVVGPFRVVDDADAKAEAALPASLLEMDERLDRQRAEQTLPQMVGVPKQRADRLIDHVRQLVEALLASGFDARVTSEMHLAATREGFAQLEERNAELKVAYERVRELDALKTSFLSTVSHELRTPLTSIMGYGDMLLQGMAGPITDEQKEFLGVIQRQGEDLLRLIMTLLDMSKLEQGTMTVEKEAVPIHDLLHHVVTTLTPRAIDRGIFIDLAAPPEGARPTPAIYGDPDRLRQVFLNVVENAIKFSAAGDAIRLSAGAHQEAEAGEVGYVVYAPMKRKVEVRIADTGPGIPQRARNRIFDAFYQLDSTATREHSGAGLGLNIVKRLIDAHGGSIHVEDNEPKGSVFVIRLPVWTKS